MKITISILCYNYGRYLTHAIESCLQQDASGCELEVLVIDDGSTDNTPEICARYSGRIRVQRSANEGFGASLRKALELARGDYVCLLDADDYFLPGKLQALLPALRAGRLFVWHDQRQVDAEDNVLLPVHEGGNTSTLCVHKASALTLLPGTTELFAHPLKDAGHGEHLPLMLSAYRIHAKSMTDRSPTSHHTAFFARTAHLVADRMEQLAGQGALPEWLHSRAQARRIARRYRAEGLTKDLERRLELPGAAGVAGIWCRAMWAWTKSGRVPERRHGRYSTKGLLRYFGITVGELRVPKK